jgi:hypothetical protein
LCYCVATQSSGLSNAEKNASAADKARLEKILQKGKELNDKQNAENKSKK